MKHKILRRIEKKMCISKRKTDQSKRDGSILMLSGAVFLTLTTIAGLAINIAYIELVRSEQRLATDAAAKAALVTRFKTILPGKYPGRTPHIHFRVLAKNRPELITQLYFAHHEELNRKDNIYMALNIGQRDGVTTKLEKTPVDATKKEGE